MKKIAIIVLSVLFLASCYQPPEPGTGIIRINDVNGFRVPGAYVRLSQPGQTGQGNLVIDGLTDFSGEFSYTHDPMPELHQTYDVIFNVSAEKDGAFGTGIIAIRTGETNYETITLY